MNNVYAVMKNQNYLWHPNTQMLEWTKFPKIVRGEGMWLIDDDGNKLLDGVASMWCNVWGHSKKELISAIIKQTKKLQHSSLFNLTNEPAEMLAKKLIKMSPNMAQVFFSDNGSTAMEIAIKIALQYWDNLELKNKTKIATLENGYHGDTFGAMSVGYVPEFFSKFRSKLFSTLQFKVPRQYHLPRNITLKEFENICLEKIEDKLSKDDTIAAFVMESGAQVAGGVNIYPKNFQKRINAICKKYNVLFVLDEIATGFGRLGSMIEYKNQDLNTEMYYNIIKKKTASLIESSVASSALLSGVSNKLIDSFRTYGLNVGLGFQIRDDILGICGDTKFTGKPVGADILRKKNTLPVIFAMEQLRGKDIHILSNIYHKSDVTENELQTALDIIESVGGIKYSNDLAQKHEKIAVNAIKELKISSEVHIELRNIATFLLTRDH